MRAVMSEVPQSILDWRRRTGADKFDEMWEGVLHMIPTPTIGHQDFEGELEAWFRIHWAPKSSGRVLHNVNVSCCENWHEDHRVPDLVLILPNQFGILRDTHLQGPPSAAIEIRSPHDETYEKLPFYAKLGVPEIWVVDRDTKVPELYVLAEGTYDLVAADEESWLCSEVTDVEFRAEETANFGIRLKGDETSYRALSQR